jgi:GNAT superfamily N-acetyltransferase
MQDQRKAVAAPRLADASDAPAICALINSAYRGEGSRQGWTTETDLVGGRRMDEATLAEMIATEGNAILLYEDDHGPIASVFLERRGDDVYLGLLSVRPARQADGIGKRLIAEAERWVTREWGAARMVMTVISRRHELIAWYKRRGYRLTGELKPFDINDERFGLPKVDGLEFASLEKDLA